MAIFFLVSGLCGLFAGGTLYSQADNSIHQIAALVMLLSANVCLVGGAVLSELVQVRRALTRIPPVAASGPSYGRAAEPGLGRAEMGLGPTLGEVAPYAHGLGMLEEQLVRAGLVSMRDLQRAKAAARQEGTELGDQVLRLGLLTDEAFRAFCRKTYSADC